MSRLEEAIQQQREAQNRPCNWLHITEAERYQLLAGVVPESVKLACYELGDDVCEAKLIQNSEKVEKPRQEPLRRTKSSGRQRTRMGEELFNLGHPDAECGHPERKARP